MISLIVKGNRYEAGYAAAQHGVPFAFRREVVRAGSKTGETVGLTASENRDNVVKWFGDGSRIAPFPVGTLLLFTEL
jgi:hypothetical protein